MGFAIAVVMLELGYKDMDGDGVEEILLWSELLPASKQLMILDRTGREITRQLQCETGIGYNAESGLCPIVGGGMHIEAPDPHGRRDILVDDWIGQPRDDVDDAPPQRFRLVDGRYAPCAGSSNASGVQR